MAGGSYKVDLGPESKHIAWVEGLGNPWVPVIAWLEHLDPLAKPADPRKLITVMVALRFRDSLTDPSLDKWAQAIIVKNETSSIQKLKVHFLAADSSLGEFTISKGETAALDEA
jgi:hypothetical protein